MISLSIYRPAGAAQADRAASALAEAELESAAIEADNARREELARTAQNEALKKQLAYARKMADAIRALSVSVDQEKKAMARERLKEIKQRIQDLLRMLALFGGKGSKSLLQELKQLSNQLREAAAILSAPSSGSSGGASPGDAGSAGSAGDTGGAAEAASASAAGADQAVPVGAVETEGRQAYAEQQASADVEAADGASGAKDENQAGNGIEAREKNDAAAERQETAQRAEDARMVDEIKRKLDAFLASVERMVKQEEQDARRAKR
jgi:hypothetical protein